MITKNPFEGLIATDELFPSSSEMIHGTPELVKKAFTIIFCALDLSRSVMGRRGAEEVWASAFLAATYGIRATGEDEASIKQIAGDLAIMTDTPQDIRLYSIFRRIRVAQQNSGDPDGFMKRIASVLRMLVNSEDEQADMFTSEIWGCIRDSFAIYERLTNPNNPPTLLYPVAGGLSMRVREFVMELQTSKFHHADGEPWKNYVQHLWDSVVEKAFPYMGVADEANESSHEQLDGKELRDRRLSRARHLRFKYPEGFEASILEEFEDPFMTCGLFDGENKKFRELVMKQTFSPQAYRKQYAALLKGVRYSVPTTVMPRASFDKILEDGEFKSLWQLPEGEWDFDFCDRPQDARAVNDMRLFGEKGGRVTYAFLVLPIDDEKTVNMNTQYLCKTHGKGDPVIVQLRGQVKEQATLTWGDSFQNFVVTPFSDAALAWLLEARFFLSTLGEHPMAREIASSLLEAGDIWKGFMQMFSGQKHPYFELQIHGRIGLEWIKRADSPTVDGEPVSLSQELKQAINVHNNSTGVADSSDSPDTQ